MFFSWLKTTLLDKMIGTSTIVTCPCTLGYWLVVLGARSCDSRLLVGGSLPISMGGQSNALMQPLLMGIIITIIVFFFFLNHLMGDHIGLQSKIGGLGYPS